MKVHSATTANRRHARRGVGRVHHDRAAVVASAIMQILQTAPADQCRRAVEAYLRDEFASIERQVAVERGGDHA